MPQTYEPRIPKNVGEIVDHLSTMLLTSPTFKDRTGYFPHRNVETVFFALNGGLAVIRPQVGEGEYQTLIAMSNRMRAHFEADPEDKTGDAKAGRRIIQEMESLLERRLT